MNAAPVDGPPLPQSAPSTLLVLEDDVVTRSMICDALRHAGYKVLEASSAKEAIAVLKTIPVDLVFADVHIPGEGDGLSVARYARALEPEVKIVITSGKVQASDVPELRELGPFVAKPYLISRIIQLVRRALESLPRNDP